MKDAKELFKLLQELGTKPQELLRAALYIQKIREAKTFFKEELKTSLGSDYSKVELALQAPELLTKLAEYLDEYVEEAVIALLISLQKIEEVTSNPPPKNLGETPKNYKDTRLKYEEYRETKGEDYKKVFQEKFFGDNFDKNVSDFLGRYPRTKHAIDQATSNFTRNIKSACERIIADWQKIEGVFVKQEGSPHKSLTRLKKIEVSGSDFHKGGQQVLFLTFITADGDLKLIYKPSDMEADCLLIGDSQRVNQIVPNFKGQSLMEIINTLIKAKKQTDQTSSLIEMPTYKILPCSYGSTDSAPAIKDSYGYIEFLHHTASDYIINTSQNKEKICGDFYQLIGQIIAIACTFSIGDIHSENLIVHQYKPHLIDLELSLVKPMPTISTTGLFIPKAPTYASITGTGKQCRLQTDQGDIDPSPYCASICTGTEEMLTLLRENVEIPLVNTWFSRIKKVIVRQVPIDTQYFSVEFNQLFAYNNCAKDMVDSFEEDVVKAFTNVEIKAYGYWLTQLPKSKPAHWQVYWLSRTFPDPLFFALNKTYLLKNFKDLDIPVYYHRVGANDLLDYDGNEIKTVATPFIGDAHCKKFLEVSFNMAKYFPVQDQFGQPKGPPTDKHMTLQFKKLAQDQYFSDRKKALVDEIKKNLAPQGVATVAEQFIQ